MARTANSLPAFLLAFRSTLINGRTINDPITGALTTYQGATTDSCTQIVSEEKTLEIPQGQYIAMIIPGDLLPEDQGGEGNWETIFTGDLRIRMIAENILDNATSDVTSLTDTQTTTGLYVLFQSILNLVRFWDLCDPNGNSYLVEPMRIKRGPSKPRRWPDHVQYIISDLDMTFRICIANGNAVQ